MRCDDGNAGLTCNGNAPVREIDSSNATIGVNLNTDSLHIVCSVRPASKVRQIKLNLVPPFVQTHWHGTNEWLDSRRGLIIRRTKSSLHSFVIQNLYLECEILIEILDNHYEKWEFDAQCLLGLCGTNDIVCRNIGAHDLEHRALNVLVCNSIDVSILHFGIPNLKRLRPYGVQNG